VGGVDLGQFTTAYAIKRQSPLLRPHSMAGSKVHSREWARAAAGLAFFALVAGCFSFYQHTRRELTVAVAKKQAEVARVQNLEVEVGRLELDLHRLRTDPALVETVGRSLGMVRPGDVVVHVATQSSGASEQFYVVSTPPAAASSSPQRAKSVKSDSLTSSKLESYTVNSF
jgi:cell division protein FtsB